MANLRTIIAILLASACAAACQPLTQGELSFSVPEVVTCSDTDAANFIIRSGISSTNTQQAICSLVSSLKSQNLWTNLSCIYPFCNTSISADALNLKSTNYTLSWVGSLSNNTAYHQSGIISDGSNYAIVPISLSPVNQSIIVSLQSTAASTCYIAGSSTNTIAFAIIQDVTASQQKLYGNTVLPTVITNGSSVVLDDYVSIWKTNSMSYLVNSPLSIGLVSGDASDPISPLSLNNPMLLGMNQNDFGPLPSTPGFRIKIAAFGYGMNTNQLLAMQSILSTYNSQMLR